jgi:hypothetical protein
MIEPDWMKAMWDHGGEIHTTMEDAYFASLYYRDDLEWWATQVCNTKTEAAKAYCEHYKLHLEALCAGAISYSASSSSGSQSEGAGSPSR